MEKPEHAKPMHIAIKLVSSKNGPIRDVATPQNMSAEIIVTRYSTHLGIKTGVKNVPKQ